MGPPGFHNVTTAAASESLRVIRDLEKAISKKPRDASLWYRKGMIAWTLAARDYIPPPIEGLDWTLLGHAADSSLRIAADIDPTRTEYKLAAGRYLASSFGPVNRTAALVLYNSAIIAARNDPDLERRAEALTTAGRMYWRFYDSMEQLDYPDVSNATSGQLFGEATGGIRNVSARCTSFGDAMMCVTDIERREGADFDGEYYYLKSQLLFREAYDADPKSRETYLNFARLLVARNRWSEAAALARARIQRAPRDPWGWFVLGLATYRSNSIELPQAAFDSALARLDAPTRARLDRIERVVRTRDSVGLTRLSAGSKRAWENLYWRVADPMWSIKGNEPRTEFLARVAYAELRWTMEETGQIGAETERGEAYIRYGPPSSIRAWVDTMRLMSVWRGKYPFTFMGYDRLRYEDPGAVRDRFEEIPVYWVGLRQLYVDSMPTQVVRFRATDDSADVLFAQTAPPEQGSTGVASMQTPNAFLWLVRDDLTTVARDSASTLPLAQRVFHHRVRRGSYLMRAETSLETVNAAGRSTGVLTISDTSSAGFALRGSGLSDILVGRDAAENANAKRWADIDITPLSGPIVRGEELALLWENYDFAADSGTAKYNIRIVIERDRSSPGGIVANIVRGLAGAVGVNREENKLEMSFDRTVAHAPVLLDNLAIDLADTPNGRYRLSVTVTDKGSGRSFVRATTFSIRD
jgi:GWxTD domain-containing protein